MEFKIDFKAELDSRYAYISALDVIEGRFDLPKNISEINEKIKLRCPTYEKTITTKDDKMDLILFYIIQNSIRYRKVQGAYKVDLEVTIKPKRNWGQQVFLYENTLTLYYSVRDVQEAYLLDELEECKKQIIPLEEEFDELQGRYTYFKEECPETERNQEELAEIDKEKKVFRDKIAKLRTSMGLICDWFELRAKEKEDLDFECSCGSEGCEKCVDTNKEV